MSEAKKQSQASPGGESLPLALPDTVAGCHLVIESLLQRLAQLHEQLQVVQERLELDSRNSSKPPSSDGPGKGQSLLGAPAARLHPQHSHPHWPPLAPTWPAPGQRRTHRQRALLGLRGLLLFRWRKQGRTTAKGGCV